MARHPIPLVGNSIHGQSQAALLRLHQQSLEKTLNSTITVVDSDTDTKQPYRNKKKKKYYPWIQRDSLNQRNKIGLEGSRRRQRYDNDKFVHHPCAVLYQVDLPFPGYDRDAPTFHWKYDAVVETLINNNPPSSRRSKPATEGAQGTKTGASLAMTEPKIGHHLLTRAQRKDIKKVHVPQGVVMQYEGELVSFLDQLTLSTNDDDKDDCKSDFCLSESVVVVSNDSTHAEIDASNWVLVQPSDVSDLPESSSSSPTTITTIATEASVDTTVSSSEKDSVALDDSDEQPQIFLRWDIQDQFLRFVAHALCAFYGLVSFSKTALDGKRHLYICHPTHLESIGKLATPETSATRPKPLRRQRTLEHVQELPLQELEQLWKKVEPIKLADCPRPDMTFFEYLYPSTQPVF
ncbi:MAG: hypothetical protein J3Q66DRAFT_344952 [Benniella sp.]|nr:MAG: hypothetical protein J3Q66DRAFT_344952 [Benniella sp.]